MAIARNNRWLWLTCLSLPVNIDPDYLSSSWLELPLRPTHYTNPWVNQRLVCYELKSSGCNKAMYGSTKSLTRQVKHLRVLPPQRRRYVSTIRWNDWLSQLTISCSSNQPVASSWDLVHTNFCWIIFIYLTSRLAQLWLVCRYALSSIFLLIVCFLLKHLCFAVYSHASLLRKSSINLLAPGRQTG